MFVVREQKNIWCFLQKTTSVMLKTAGEWFAKNNITSIDR